MAIQYSVTVNNARLDAIESTIGTTPTLEIRTGAAPANCGTASSGTVLATMTLPSDWMAAAASASKAIVGGPWQDTSADATGTAAHFRIFQGATCHMQGTVTATGGGGDLQLVTTSLTATQLVQITAFTINAGNQ